MLLFEIRGPVSAGPLNLLIMILLFIITFLLIRNMSGRLKRLPKEFEQQEPRGRRARKAAQRPAE